MGWKVIGSWNRRTYAKLFITVLLCAIFAYTILYVDTGVTVFKDYPSHFVDFDKEYLVGSKLIIDTEGCKIPRTPIVPEYYRSRWHLEQIPDCSYEKSLSTLTDDQIIILNSENADSDCCLQEITRLENEDHGYNLSPCQEFPNLVNVSKKEILLTKCGKYMNFDVNIPVKPPIQEKIDFWSNFTQEDLPPSIILFGVDTLSRSHAFRSLPKTLELMKKMDFIDFNGYHSAGSGTFHNFVAFLMGKTRQQAMEYCAPNWTSPFDSCPFVWKEFSQQNYITLYIEDGSQTFNWGGQGGFHQRPTDYYMHSMFSAIKDIRGKAQIWKNEDTIDCTSTETVSQFVIRYTQKFIKKFQNVPTFSFTWLEDPFHDNQYTLGKLDEKIMGFFQMLDTLPKFLERSLVIFLSDHGDRFSPFQTTSTEGFIERGLPPLFIRFPESMKAKFPNLDKVLKESAQSLTTPFDVHHTFQHILNDNRNSGRFKQDDSHQTEFKPVMEDRASLFFPIDTNRSCVKVQVDLGVCRCGTSLTASPIQNPFYLSKILAFAEQRLNEIVSSSNYKNVCATWTTSVDKIISSKVLTRTDNSTDNIIQFTAMPGDAKFEVKIKVIHSSTNFDGCELIGDFVRVDSYGTQSSCVGFEAKKMKEMCMCKEYLSRLSQKGT